MTCNYVLKNYAVDSYHGLISVLSLTKKKVSWRSSVKVVSYSKMSATDRSQMTEFVTLLEGRPQPRCCCGRFRIYGSDGAWSWGVAFANFLVNFIIVGLGRMSGIFYVDFINIFRIDRKTASIPFSVQQAGRNLFGPAAGILGQKYGLRFVTLLGGVIGSVSAFSTYFKMDITSMTVFWGIFFGLSTALTTTLNQASIDEYFERHRATAGGFAFSGGCVGAVVFPVIIETLIQCYGMKDTFLVIGAIILIVVPAAMVLVEPPWNKNSTSDTSYARNIKEYGAFKFGKSPHSITQGEKKNDPAVKTDINFGILRENSDMVFQFLTMDISDGSVRPKTNQNNLQKLDKTQVLKELESIYSTLINLEMNQKNIDSSNPPKPNRSSQVSLKTENKNFDEDRTTDTNANDDLQSRIFIQHKLQELSGIRGTRIVSHFPYPEQHRAWKILIELRKLSDELTELPNIESIYENGFKTFEKMNDDPKLQQDAKKHANSFCRHFKTALKLHGNPLFLLICLCRGVFMITFIPFVTIIVDFAMDKGLHKSDGKYIIAVLSLGDFIGRLGFGWVTDRKCISMPRYMLFGMILLGASTATLPLMHSKFAILGSVLIFAILQGSLFVRHPMLVSNYVKNHEKSIGMGFINFLSGFLGFALPFFIGYFRDQLGSYDQMFYLSGMICAVVGLLWLLEPIFLFLCPDSEDS